MPVRGGYCMRSRKRPASGGGLRQRPPPDGILRRPAPDDILPQSPVPPLAPTCPSGRHSAAAAPDGILPQSPVPPSDGMLRQPGPPLASGGIQRRRPAPGDILPQDPPPPGRCGRSADRRARRSSDPCADGRKRRGSPRLRHFFRKPYGPISEANNGIAKNNKKILKFSLLIFSQL